MLILSLFVDYYLHFGMTLVCKIAERLKNVNIKFKMIMLRDKSIQNDAKNNK